jgi:O-antigen ligase
MTAVLQNRRPDAGSGYTPVPLRRGVAPPELGGKPWWRPDAVAFLSFWAFLLMLIPSRLVFGPAGAVGHPSTLFGLGLAAWWAVSHVIPHQVRRGFNPMKVGLEAFAVLLVITYALGYGRGLPPVEASAADRKLLMFASVMGVAVFAIDAVPNRRRLDKLLRRLTIFAAANAVVAIIQFTTKYDLAARVVIPGLHPNSQFTDFKSRGAGDFARVTGTSTHPIEFGVMMALVLPIAIHYALHAAPANRFRRWVIVAVIAGSIPMSVSRSGTLALFVVALVLANAWAPRIKLQAAGVAMAGVVAFSGVVPGLLGTIRSSFTNLSSDPSIEGRTSDYNIVFTYIGNRPWFGRGPGTFLPSRYIVLDNEALYTLTTMGYVGLVAVVALVVGAALVARNVSRNAGDDASRHLAIALMAPVIAALVVSLTFDSLSFPIFTGLVFFIFGAIGALWRLDRAGDRSGQVRRRTSLLKGWRSIEHHEPHGLWAPIGIAESPERRPSAFTTPPQPAREAAAPPEK